MPFESIICRRGQTDHIRCEERSGDRHGHNHRIEEVADDAQRQSQRGNDERELTNLRHRESAAHGRLQRLTAQHERYRAKDCLTYKNRQHQQHDGQGIVHQDLRINEHTHRHEEDGTEEVLHRLYQLLDTLCLDRLCQDATHDKRAEGRAEAHLRRKHCHRTAESQRHHQQHLVVDETAHPTEEQRNGKDSHHEPEDQEESYPHDGLNHLSALQVVTAGDGTQHHHHHNGEDILQYQHAHHHAGKLLLPQSQIVEGLIDNRRR